ncbi:MAG TPA: molybdenum cofactor cytidylyltransferase [Ktedonobacterales bacterium]|nr:molybdenum cofactor cytidylyltransferase [Ktedonobacterales bacterium]
MIAAIILAAGQSSRMGQHKLLLPLLGKPLLLHAVENATAAGFDEVLVVVGYHAGAVRELLARYPVRLVENPDYAQGQSTSVRAGVAALSAQTDAVMMLLGDQPLVHPAILQRLMHTWQATDRPIVAPYYAGQRGNPVLFARALFPELLGVSGDQGGREILQRHAAEIEPVPIAEAHASQDLDTWQEYQALLKRLGQAPADQ